MLYLVGLGLGGIEDITLKGLKLLKESDEVYLEHYTSLLIDANVAEMEAFYGKKITLADRELIESGAASIISAAKSHKVALLVVGDPFGATTHSDLFMRAISEDVEVSVVHNASILNAVGCCGLQLYRFGEIVSIVLWTDNWKPTSYFDKIVANCDRGLHTLCLLDIKMKERSVENIIRNRSIYEPPKFMTIGDACAQLLESMGNKSTESNDSFNDKTVCFGLARIGSTSQKIVAGTLHELIAVDFGSPLHSLIVCGTLHPLEVDFINYYAASKLK